MRDMAQSDDRIALHLLELIEQIASIQNRKPSAIARRLGGNGHAYAALKRGSYLSTEVASRMLANVPAEWPDETPLPAFDVYGRVEERSASPS